jgi:hypothetical protein
LLLRSQTLGRTTSMIGSKALTNRRQSQLPLSRFATRRTFQTAEGRRARRATYFTNYRSRRKERSLDLWVYSRPILHRDYPIRFQFAILDVECGKGISWSEQDRSGTASESPRIRRRHLPQIAQIHRRLVTSAFAGLDWVSIIVSVGQAMFR